MSGIATGAQAHGTQHTAPLRDRAATRSVVATVLPADPRGDTTQWSPQAHAALNDDAAARETAGARRDTIYTAAGRDAAAVGDVPEAERLGRAAPMTVDDVDDAVKHAADDAGPSAESHAELSDDDQADLDRLSHRDTEVRTHEQAHAARGGQFAGSPQYEYEVGPDGRRYAVEGSVSIDVAPVQGNPEATMRKMETVRAAATAPASPSAADRAVAATASRRSAEAKAEIAASQTHDARPASTRTSIAAYAVHAGALN